MTERMDGKARQNTGNRLDEGRGAARGSRLARDRGGPRRHEPPDEWLERAMHDVYIALKKEEGRGAYASRGIANAAHGITTPHRSLAKRIREGRAGRANAAAVRRIGEVLVEYTDRLFGKSA